MAALTQGTKRQCFGDGNLKLSLASWSLFIGVEVKSSCGCEKKMSETRRYKSVSGVKIFLG